jgi:hypothetical protein
MTIICDRCGGDADVWGMKALVSLDYKPTEPSYPPDADMESDHLCEDCRDSYIKWREQTENDHAG